jgi:S1-C subfamily serine protease
MSDPLIDLSRRLADLAGRVGGHLVAVRSGPRVASGFVWREGLVVTADEALEAEEGLQVHLPDGSRAEATLAGRDPSTDVALLRVAGALPPPLALDGSGARAVGEVVLALGRGAEGPVAAMGVLGSVGPAWRSLRGGTIEARLALDLRLPRAAEGGVAVDAEGRAFGMAVFGPRRTALAIPAETIERIAPRLLERGRIARGYLGLGLQPVRIEGSGEMGVVVVSVDPEGPGRRAGIVQGDILVAFAGEPVQGLRQRLGPDSVGREVELSVLRGGERRSVAITVGEAP